MILACRQDPAALGIETERGVNLSALEAHTRDCAICRAAVDGMRDSYRAALAQDALRRTREDLGVTQQQLADALLVPRETVARWERGTLAIGQPQILEYALAYLREHPEVLAERRTRRKTET